MKTTRLFLLLTLALLLRAHAAQAHTLQVTGVVVHADDNATTITVMVHLPLLGAADPAAVIPQRLHIRLDGVSFQPSGASILHDPNSDTVTWSARQVRHADTIQIDSPLFPDRSDDTTVVLIYRGDHLADRFALTPAHPSATVGESIFTVVRRFVSMGILHILTGPDHILFLLGLVLAGGTIRQLFALVTAFTLAHSLTLSLTALGVASLSPRLVEPIIAFSIVAVALENLLHKNSGIRLRIALAFGFGFFHGFGFAGALTEVGLPTQAIAWSLAAFNIGVEIGQACILLVVLPILIMVQRHSQPIRTLVTRYASFAIASAGAFWFFERINALWRGVSL